MKILKFLALLLVIFTFSCNNDDKEYEQDLDKIEVQAERNTVDVIILKSDVFYKELVSNGKLSAKQKTVMRFQIQGKLAKIFNSNGSYVLKNGKIASLDTKTAYRELELAKLDLRKSEIALNQQIIGHGYSPATIDSMPDDILNVAKISSGYSSAEINLQKAKENLNNLILKAPFSGKIANLETKIFEDISSADDFCILIDDSKFFVDFNILESELNEVNVGDRVVVTPFSFNKDYEGKIVEINPLVDQNGMILIKALVVNTDKRLMEGMNVDVRIRQALKNQLIVPKEAVVNRDDLDVLFRYTKGIAYWTYIQIVEENSNSYAVIANKDRNATLKAGDTVIITNNLNLAHESEIKIEKIRE